jgi:hypothetical protein
MPQYVRTLVPACKFGPQTLHLRSCKIFSTHNKDPTFAPVVFGLILPFFSVPFQADLSPAM